MSRPPNQAKRGNCPLDTFDGDPIMTGMGCETKFNWRWVLPVWLLVASPSLATSLPIVRQFPAPGDGCEGMAFVGSQLWVWDVWPPSEDRFYLLDPTTGAVLGSHPSPNSDGIGGLL
jgi:hypothetical protein